MTENRVRPFLNSRHYYAFDNRDCCNCTKYSADATKCEIMAALAYACIDDGTVSAKIADRLRPTAETHPHCGEFERAEDAATTPSDDSE